MELLSEAYGPSVDFTSHAVVANTRVDIVGEIEHSGSFREVEQITLRGKYIHLIFLQICGELVHQLQIVIILQCTSDIGKPFVNAAFSLSDTFIAPVGSKTMLGYIVHTFCSDLDFHPFLFRTQYGGVQTFISITLRYGQPVTHTLRIRLIHVRDDGEHLPALFVFHFTRHIKDDSDGKQVIYTFKSASLLFHFLPDGMDALCSSLHVIFQSSLIQLFLNRFDETGDISISGCFCGIQFLLY